MESNYATVPRVSVIIPMYHAGAYVRRCFDSLKNQTFKDFEVIAVVDDCFGDDTLDQIKYHSAGLNVFVIAVRGKTSPAIARNRALCWARGKYIAFLDVDDTWESEKLSKQFFYMEENPDVDVSYTKARIYYQDGRSYVFGRPVDKVPVWFDCPGAFSSFMVRRSACIPFNEKLRGSDDYRWEIDLEKHGRKFRLIPEVLVNVYVDGGNLTMDSHYKMFVQTMKLHGCEGELLLAFQKFFLRIALSNRVSAAVLRVIFKAVMRDVDV